MNLKAFPFFDSLSAMRKATNGNSPLLAPNTRFLPFQIRKPKDARPIDCVNVYRASNDSLYRTVSDLTYQYHLGPTEDYITYYGATLSQALACEVYYLEIQGKYSATFQALPSVSDLVKVEFRSSVNFGGLFYASGWLQRMYLYTVITAPEYPYEEEGEDNGYGVFNATLRKVSKVLKLDTLKVPPYLADALGGLPMHDEVHVSDYQHVQEVEVKPQWIDNDTGATVEVKFAETAPIIARFCAEEEEITQLDISGYTPRGYACGNTSDTAADWQLTGNYTCQQAGGVNTGYQLQEERDMNPSSATYNQTRTVLSTTQNTVACPVPVTYYSAAQSEYVTKNDCATGYTGSTVLVKVSAGAFTSTVSQLDADNKALSHLNSTKQATANEQGTCVQSAQVEYAGLLSAPYATGSQACSMEPYFAGYTAMGTFNTGQKLYLDSLGTQVASPSSYFAAEDGFVVRTDANSVIISYGRCAINTL